MEQGLDGVMEWFRSFFADWGMTKVYVTCAATGGFVLLVQLGLNLFGLGDGDVDVDDFDAADMDGGDGSFSMLSVRAIAGFVTFFGLVGWLGTASEWGGLPTVLAATASGTAVMFLVAWIMHMFKKLTSKGNLDPRQAVGTTARVYLRIPAAKSGQGKITVSIQGRSVEFSAVTEGDELPTGSECRVESMTTSDTFVVSALE